MLPLKKHLSTLIRIPTPDESRLEYLRLDKNENIIPLPLKILSEFKKALTADFISAYPEPGTLYKKLARHVGCKLENLYLSSGSDGAIKSVFEAFVEIDDKVLLLGPTYAMFYVYVKMFQAESVEVKYAADLSLPVEKILSQIESAQPKLICIANPNSPTGTVMKPEDLRQVMALARQKNAVILIDEAYYLFYPETCAGLINEYSNLVVTRTFSKAFGIASARFGFAVGSREMIECLQKTRPMYETNAYAVKFAGIMLEYTDVVKKNIREALKGKRFLERELKNMGLSYFKSYANFVLIDVGSKDKAIATEKALKQKKILAKGGFGFPLERCLRINIGSVGQMKRFLKVLIEVSAVREKKRVSL